MFAHPELPRWALIEDMPADKIVSMDSPYDDGATEQMWTLKLASGRFVNMSSQWVGRYDPAPGDYFVSAGGGEVFVIPKAAFETTFRSREA